MSHFTVLVIGKNPEDQLQPYHEYECTGIEDEYVIFVPAEETTAELKKKFKDHKESYSSFDEFMSDYYGYKKENNTWGRKTNPNKKWDWYCLGGRWCGYFKLKLGSNGLAGEKSFFGSAPNDGYADQVLKKDVDFEFMRNEEANKAAQKYDFAMSIIGRLEPNRKWADIREENKKDIEKARDIFWDQPRCKSWKAKEREDFKSWPFGYDASPDDFLLSREEYIQNARNSAISTFAVVKNGKWYEKGRMGFWAFVSDEKDHDKWNEEFSKLIDELPEDTLLSIYDCHI